MTLVDRILSLVTLLSLFIVTPTLGKAIVIWWGKERLKSTLSQQLAIALSTMMTIVLLTSVYGVPWKIYPKSVVWFGWINRDLPIAGDVGIEGEVEVSGKVDIGNEPLSVQIEK